MRPLRTLSVAALVFCASSAGARPTRLETTSRLQQRAAARLGFEAALDALRCGDSNGAFSSLEAALASSGGDARAPEALRFWTAEAALGAGEPVRALELLGLLASPLAAVGDEVQARRAHALEALGRPAEAAAAWQDVLQNWPHAAQARVAAFALPRTMLACGYQHGAAEGWRRALLRHPQAPEAPAARLALADLEAAGGSSVHAVPLWRQLITAPDAAVAEAARSRLARLRQIGALAPADVDELLHEADALLARRALDGAEAKLAEATARASSGDAHDRGRVDLRRAQLLRRRRDFDGARALWRQLVDGGPWSLRAAALEDWANYELNGGTPQQAALLFGRLAAQGRGVARRDAQFNVALANYLAGDDATAERGFASFVGRYPREARADEALWYAAWSAYRRGASGAAERTLSRLLARHPRSGLRWRAWYWRGRLALAAGSPGRARQAFQRTADDESGYYALLARGQLAALDERRSGGNVLLAAQMNVPTDNANVGQAGPQAAASVGRTTAQLAPSPRPFPGEVDAEFVGVQAPLGEGLAWEGPEGRRAVWLLRLGLLREAAEAVLHVPAAHGSGPHLAGTARARLACALTDYNGAMRAGIGLLGGAQGWPKEASLRLEAPMRLAFPQGFDALVRPAAQEFGVEPALVWAIMRQESAFIVSARSTSMARGLMQVMPQTGRAIAKRLDEDGYTDQDILAPHTNVRFGAWYLMALTNNYRGNLPLAIAAYNAGPEAVDGWLLRWPRAPLDEFVENVPFRETRQYVKHVLVNLDVYRQLDGAEALTLPADVDVRSTRFVTF